MEALIDTRTPLAPPLDLRALPEVGESGARRALREQIARLESELGALFVSSPPRHGLAPRPTPAFGPRLLDLEELERVRDDLAERVSALRRSIDERGRRQEELRRLREEMLLEPERHRWVRVSNEDIGERGCHHWHVRPRFGLLGMLMNWWRVKISSGCP